MEEWEELNYEEIKLALKDVIFLDYLISKFPDLTRDKLVMKYNTTLKCKTCGNLITINYVLDDLSIINVCPQCKQNNMEKPTDIRVIVNWFNRNYKFAATFDKDENLYCYDKARGVWSDEKASAVIKKECDIIFKNIPSGISTQKVNNIILSIKAGNYKQHSLFTNAIKRKENKTYVNLKNGVFILEDYKLVEYSPDFYFRGYINVKFDKDAKLPENFLKFLMEITYPSEENLINLLEAFAYPMMDGYPIQKAIALIGAGNNGKSTFLQCMENFYGEKYISHLSMQQLSNAVEGQPFSLLQILGKIANISDDLPSRAVKDVGYFKQLTGGSTIEAERKFGGRVSFVNSAKFYFAANTMPDVSEDSIAFYRRFLFIEFGNRIEKPRNSKELIAELTSEEEKSGLLNILIFIIMKKLLVNNDFSFVKSLDEIANQYQKHSNTAKLFCETFLEERYDELVEKQDIEKAYKDFCLQNSLVQITTKKFWMTFNELFSHIPQSRPQINNERKRIYMGLCLNKSSEGDFSLKTLKIDKNSNNILENYLNNGLDVLSGHDVLNFPLYNINILYKNFKDIIGNLRHDGQKQNGGRNNTTNSNTILEKPPQNEVYIKNDPSNQINSNNMLEKTGGGFETAKTTQNIQNYPSEPQNSNNMLESMTKDGENKPNGGGVKGVQGDCLSMAITRPPRVDMVKHPLISPNPPLPKEESNTQSQVSQTPELEPQQTSQQPQPPIPQVCDLTQLKDLIISYFKKAPEGLILSNCANKWDFLYGMLKTYDQTSIDQAMRWLIADEQVIEIKDGVWKRYAYGMS